MNDDENIKLPEGAEEAAEEAAEAAAETVEAADEGLNDELESLRDTFQNVLNETTAEAAEEPVIQELDYTAEKNAEDDGNASEENGAEASADKKAKKAKKEGKKKHKAAIIIPIVLCVLIILPLLAYFIITITVPDFTSFVSAYTSAGAAETDAEKASAYESALEYCGEDSKLSLFRQDVLENIVVAKCASEGYASAYSYMTKNMSEEMIAAPTGKAFKEFLNIKDSLSGIAENALAKVLETIGDKTDDEDVDYEALASAIGAPDLIKSSVAEALSYLGKGAAIENAAESKEDTQAAISAYLNGASALQTLGADATSLFETIAVKLYGHGYAYEAQLISDQYLAEDTESGSEDYKTVLADLEAIKGYKGDLTALAEELYAKGTFTEDDFVKALADAGLSEAATKAVAQMALTAADAMQAEDEKNITKASTYYSTLLGALDTFGLPAEKAAAKAISTLLSTGDTQSANSVKEAFFTEDVQVSEETKATLDELDKLYNAQYAANEAFYPFYYNASYSGEEMNKDEINAALDALITDDSNDYDKAFVNYYKYLAEAFTDSDTETMKGYLDSFAAVLADYPLVYGYAAAQLSQQEGDLAKAGEIADKMLAVNTADDFANSVKALALRASGDVDGALAAAEKGMELSGAIENCAYEAAVDKLLKGEYEEAFELAKQLYASQLTTNYCELIMIISEKYDGDNADVKAELEQYAAEVNETYANYGVEASDAAKGLIDGTLTLEDVFLKAPYDFG